MFIDTDTLIGLPFLKWLIALTATTAVIGFPSGTGSQESACQRRGWKRRSFDPWSGNISSSRKWQPAPVFLPGESHGQRSLAGYSPWSHEESDTTEWVSTSTTATITILNNRLKLQVVMVVIIVVGIIYFCFLSVLAPWYWKYLDYPLDKYPSQLALVLVQMSNCTPSFGRWPKDGGTDSSLQQHLGDTMQWCLWLNWGLSYLLLPSKAWAFSLILWFLSAVYLRATQYIFFFHKLAKWFALLGNQKSLNNKNFPGKSTCGLPQVGCHFLLLGTFLTQGSNPGLPHCRQMLYTLSHQGSPDNKIILVIEVLIVIIIFFKVIVAIATVYLLCIMFWALFWWGTHVHPWQMHVDVWQNQYNIVK